MTIFEARTTSVGEEHQQVRHTDELPLTPEEKILQLEAALEAMKAALALANRQRDELVVTIREMGHEFNNYMSLPTGIIELGQSDPTIFTTMPELVEESKEALTNATRLVGELHTLALKFSHDASPTPSHTSHPSSSPVS